MSYELRLPYLVQRVSRRTFSGGTGIDRHFTFDYMGSAEFEFGALPTALRQMRAARERMKIAEVLPPSQCVKGVAVERLWFLGDPSYLPQAMALLHDQLGVSPPKYRLKECTYMATAFRAGEGTRRQFDAWWALDTEKHERDSVPWLLFVRREDAEQWLKEL